VSAATIAARWRRRLLPRLRTRAAVTVLVCGSPDRGDDGAAFAAIDRIRPSLPPGTAVRTVGQLDVDDLLAIPRDAAVVVVDTARGIRPGAVRCLPLGGLLNGSTVIRPRSSHALAMPEVIGLADMLRGWPIRGRIVVIGGREFGLGAGFSPRVECALGTLGAAVLRAVSELRVTTGEA
jgi:hydrogenase maturation protease